MRTHRHTPPDPARIRTYFLNERQTLAVVTLAGLIYNIGLAAGPWFEGQMVQLLYEILKGRRTGSDMLRLALLYVMVILSVQAARFSKRLFVRRFANSTLRSMKHTLYHNLLARPASALRGETGIGGYLNRAVSDAEACAEGMRKATTEVFDTGVVMIVYLVMLLALDVRLTLITILFPPAAYILAGKLKRRVTGLSAEARSAADRLGEATCDRAENALTYRVYGQEANRNARYEAVLEDCERRSILAGFWQNAMQPVYFVISMAGTVPILSLGIRNVTGSGWTHWNIAALTTYLACFTRLAAKSSHAAKLFNAVQKADVSWKRIRPLLSAVPGDPVSLPLSVAAPAPLTVSHLSFRSPDGKELLRDISFEARPGQIIGVTGSVASGKSALGRVFLCETPYDGSIRFGSAELWHSVHPDDEACLPPQVIGYLGHDPELISASVEENITLGDADPGGGHDLLTDVLTAVCMDQEVLDFRDGIRTRIGEGGLRLSGGQKARLALARTLYHRRPVMILDDPFASVDSATERRIQSNLRRLAGDCIIILISHRLACFPDLDGVLWMKDGTGRFADHTTLMLSEPEYAALYSMQTAGEEAAGHEKTE